MERKNPIASARLVLCWLLAGSVLWAVPVVQAQQGLLGGRRGRERLQVWIAPTNEPQTRIDFPAAGHYGIPGVVAVNKLPYRCELHHQDFATEEAFAAHLRLIHKLQQRDLSTVLAVHDGQVHFGGEL